MTTKDASIEDGWKDTSVVEALQTQTFQTALSDNPFFIQSLDYTRKEEAQVIRILDTRLFPWVLLTTFVLNMDRTNISNAISDNLPQDLGFTIDWVNAATAVYAVLFSIFCFTGAYMAKIVGPARCRSCAFQLLSPAHDTPGIPFLMFSWGLVTLAHALIKDKAGYMAGAAIFSLLLSFCIDVRSFHQCGAVSQPDILSE